MSYFYDYFVKDYHKRHMDRLFPSPAAMLEEMDGQGIHICRKVLRNAFCGYREGQKAEILKKLVGEYRIYVSGCHDGRAKDVYNAFIYRYMVPVHVGSGAISSRLGVTKSSVQIYIRRALDEVLALCMGIPVMVPDGLPEERAEAVRILIEGSRLFDNMASDYVLDLFPGRKERDTVEHGRQLTAAVMEQFTEAAGAYSDYCNDRNTRIDTDIRKAEILEKCLAGVTPAAIAAEYGCHECTVYADIRENEKRIAAMMFFDAEGEHG